MYLSVKIRMKSAWLGDMHDRKNSIRRFPRRGGLILLPVARWQKSCRTAASLLELDCNINRVQFPDTLAPPTIHEYRRRINRVTHEIFESIRGGTVVSFTVFLRTHESRSPDREQFIEIMKLVGRDFGISHFGNQYGYGRFDIEEICPCRPPV